MNYNFRVGDRIIGISEHFKGYVGKIVDIKDNCQFGVEFETHFGGHDCDGAGKRGYCRWFYTTEYDGSSDATHRGCNQSVTQIKLFAGQLEFSF